MAANPPTPPAKLVDAVAKGRAVLFAGAGLSLAAGLPTWTGLLDQLASAAATGGYLSPAESAQLRRAVKEGKYLMVADRIRRALGSSDFDRALDEIFRGPGLKPTSLHALIAEIGFSAVVTTNYDKLIEGAFASHGIIPPTYTFDDGPDIISALSHNRFFILKAHGDIDRKTTIILSERDYRNVLYRQPGYRAALNTIFITKTILFVGTSLSDVDVKLILESVSESFSGKGPGHYCLLPQNGIADAEVEHWRDLFGIHLLRYKPSAKHPEVEAFLTELKKATGMGTAAAAAP